MLVCANDWFPTGSLDLGCSLSSALLASLETGWFTNTLIFVVFPALAGLLPLAGPLLFEALCCTKFINIVSWFSARPSILAICALVMAINWLVFNWLINGASWAGSNSDTCLGVNDTLASVAVGAGIGGVGGAILGWSANNAAPASFATGWLIKIFVLFTRLPGVAGPALAIGLLTLSWTKFNNTVNWLR